MKTQRLLCAALIVTGIVFIAWFDWRLAVGTTCIVIAAIIS